MEKDETYYAGRLPSSLKENPSQADFREEVFGLKEAIRATRKRIAKDGTSFDLEDHLKSLIQQLHMAEERLIEYEKAA